MDKFCIVIVEMISGTYKHQIVYNIKLYLTVYFKHVQFIVRKIYSQADLGRGQGVLDLYPRERPRGWTYPLLHAVVGVVCDFGDEGQRTCRGERSGELGLLGRAIWLPPPRLSIVLSLPPPPSPHLQGLLSGWHQFFPWLGVDQAQP